jgi:hypothetical protein
MANKQFFRPQPMAANSAYNLAAIHLAGFLASAAGTLTVTDKAGVVVVNALPVAVGYNKIPIMVSTPEGMTVQLAGGAAGSLLI